MDRSKVSGTGMASAAVSFTSVIFKQQVAYSKLQDTLYTFCNVHEQHF
jgi:hypothetical protein